MTATKRRHPADMPPLPAEPAVWHVAAVRERAEWMACRLLRRLGCAAFYPWEARAVPLGRRTGRWRIGVKVPRFPGYLFVGDPAAVPVEAVPGVVVLLRTAGGKPFVVPTAQVAAQRAQCADDGELLPAHRSTPNGHLRRGDRVRVGAGPFVDAVGKVLESRSCEVLVELAMFGGRPVKVRLWPQDVVSEA